MLSMKVDTRTKTSSGDSPCGRRQKNFPRREFWRIFGNVSFCRCNFVPSLPHYIVKQAHITFDQTGILIIVEEADMLFYAVGGLFRPQIRTLPQGGKIQRDLPFLQIFFQDCSCFVSLSFAQRGERIISIEDVLTRGKSDILLGLSVADQKYPLYCSFLIHIFSLSTL